MTAVRLAAVAARTVGGVGKDAPLTEDLTVYCVASAYTRGAVTEVRLATVTDRTVDGAGKAASLAEVVVYTGTGAPAAVASLLTASDRGAVDAGSSRARG